MAYTINFTTKLEGETIEEGFTTSFSDDISEALVELQEEVEMSNIDEMDIKIIKLKFKK